jgi:hypothetical protein
VGISERKGDGSLSIRERKGMKTWALMRGKEMDLLVLGIEKLWKPGQ